MKKSVEYINKDGVEFDIDIENAQVPKEANYWGFYLKVTERPTKLYRVFHAMIKKEICENEILAEAFVESDSLDYLKSVFLDNYKDGRHPIIWPDLIHGWVVI